jgi:hypothetical protein
MVLAAFVALLAGTACSGQSPHETATAADRPTASVVTAEGFDDGAGSRDTGPPVYPLKVSTSGRYLVDQRDRPWRIQADAAWTMSVNATPDEVDTYLTTRERQGFNSFYLMAIVHQNGFDAAKKAPRNRQGDQPFAKAGDFSTAATTPETQRYWAGIDSIIDKAAAHHMVVMLSYTYLGWSGGNQGWYAEVMAQPSRQSLFDWGNWLGTRYKDKPNIIWFGLGDFTPPAGSEGALRSVAMADGIKAAGARQLFMAESSPPDTLATEAADFARVLDMNSFYGYGPDGVGTVYETAQRSRTVSPPKPAWMQEGTYEYENNWGHFSGKPWDTRRARFWSVLAGATAGDGFGSRDVWQWKDIPESLSSPGAAYATYAFDLFASLPWWDLEPSGKANGFAGVDLLTAGEGTWGKLDYITAARTAGRDWLLAYVPVMKQGPRNFKVDMSSLEGPVRARWFDPATGAFLDISTGYEYDHSGVREFTTPGKRSDGTDDWLLVLDTEG